MVKIQNISGNWDSKNEVSKILSLSLDKIASSMPSEIKDETLWLTILVLAWIETCFEDSYSSW